MKRHWISLIALTLAVSSYAVDEVKVKVIGDRVSLRAAPEINSVLLDRTMSGDLLTLKDNSKKEWIGVAPPYTMDVWVHSDYIREGKVMPARLNIRSGPSLNHGVVGVVERGELLTIRGEAGKWLRIAPPEETVVWISRKYTEIIGAVKEPVVMISVKPSPEPEVVAVEEPVIVITVEPSPEPEVVAVEEPVIVITVEKPKPIKKTTLVEEIAPVAKPVEEAAEESIVIVETVTQPEINQMMVAAADVSELPGTLVPDSAKEQGVEESFSGILMPAGGLLSKLVDVDVDQITVCYVRGNAAQMKELEGKALTIIGKAYWALDLDMPFIRPVKIQLFSRPE